MSTTYDLKFVAEVSGVAAGLGKIPGMSEKAAAAAALKQVTAAKKAAEQTKDIWGKAGKSIEANAKNLFGGVVGDAGDVVEAFGAIGPAGVAIGAAFALTSVGAGALARNFVDVMARADELAPKLEALAGQEIISANSIEAARVAEAQVSNLSLVSSGFAGVLVDQYAPAIEVASSAMVGFSVGALDAYKGLQDFMSGANDAASPLYDLNMAINPVAWGFQALVDNGREANVMLEEQVRALGEWEAAKRRHDAADEKMLEATKRQNEQMEREAVADIALSKSMRAKVIAEQTAALREANREWTTHVDVINRMINSGYEQQVKDETADWYARADAEIAAAAATTTMWEELDTLIDAEDRATTSAERVNDALGKTPTNWDAIKEAAAGALAVGEQLASAAGDVADMAQKYHEDKLSQYREDLAVAQKNAKSKDKLLAALGKSDADAIREKIGREKKAAMTAFRAGQGAAIAGAIMSGAQAFLGVMASPAVAASGPLAPAIAAAITVPPTALQVGVIASQKPPKFARGGEVTATLEQGEGIANKRAMAQPGFRQALDNANEGRGGGSGGNGDTHIYFNDRLIMTLMARGYRLGGLAVPAAWARAM